MGYELWEDSGTYPAKIDPSTPRAYWSNLWHEPNCPRDVLGLHRQRRTNNKNNMLGSAKLRRVIQWWPVRIPIIASRTFPLTNIIIYKIRFVHRNLYNCSTASCRHCFAGVSQSRQSPGPAEPVRLVRPLWNLVTFFLNLKKVVNFLKSKVYTITRRYLLTGK